MTTTTAAASSTYACRHCGHRHEKFAGDTTITCGCGTGRPHLACPVELAEAEQNRDGLAAALAAAAAEEVPDGIDPDTGADLDILTAWAANLDGPRGALPGFAYPRRPRVPARRRG